MVALLLLRLRLLLLLFVGVPWGLVTPSAAGAVSYARKEGSEGVRVRVLQWRPAE